jgi:hypothetical protein
MFGEMTVPNTPLGVDWPRVTNGLVTCEHDEEAGGLSGGKQTFFILGHFEELAPSKKWYSPAAIGSTVTIEEATHDLVFMAALNREAKRHGLEIVTDDDCESVFAAARVDGAGGLFLLVDGVVQRVPFER